MKRTKMDEIVENMANYICDHICQKPKEITDQEGGDPESPVEALLQRGMRDGKTFL